MTQAYANFAGQVLDPLMERILEATCADMPRPPRPIEDMTEAEGWAWVRSLAPEHHDIAVACTRNAAIQVLNALALNPHVTPDLLDALLEESRTHAGRLALVQRFYDLAQEQARGSHS
jgi:hypothetical protein